MSIHDGKRAHANPEDVQAVHAILVEHWDPLRVAGQTTSPGKYAVTAEELVMAAQNNARFDGTMIYVFLRHIELERFPGLKMEAVRIQAREKTAKAVLDYFHGKK